MPTLHIFVLHTQHLKLRAMHIHGVVQNVRLAALAEKYDVNVRLVLTPDASHIQEKLQEIAQNEINYDPVNIPIYDQYRLLLSPEMISNTKKHLHAWQQIANMKDASPDDLFLVLEDDTYTINESIENFRSLLKGIRGSPWDIIMLGLTTNENQSNMALRDLSDITEVLPCKDSYFINQATARKSYEDWKQNKFIMRVQWSYWFSQNKEVKVRVPSKRVFLDASKLGVMPSSIHANNMLIYNREYVNLAQLAALPEKDLKLRYKEAEKLYSQVSQLNSPDVMSVYGMILRKCGYLMEAKRVFLHAMEILKMHHCPVRSQSDLYQQLVNMHEKMQTDIEPITANPSMYENEEMAKPDTVLVS
jgi:GR25 family glycosyltransferase involved in LPS biosynthesis